MKKLFLLFVFFFTITQTHWFSEEQKKELTMQLSQTKNYQEQLNIIKNQKSLKDNDKIYLNEFKKSIFQKNIKTILKENKKDYEERKEIYKKYFQVVQSVDNEASVNPYYFLKLKDKIHENDMYLKTFIYIFYEIKNNLKTNKNYYSNYKETIKSEIENPLYNYHVQILDKNTFEYLKQNKYNYLSKTDLERFKKEIIKNKIWPDSKKFEYFIQYKNFLSKFKNNTLSLENAFIQKTQEKNLSCEINSASLFASYILEKDISENDIFEHINTYWDPIKKDGYYYLWGNPNEEFVWDIKWKQTKFLEKMTWYGVYAWPISSSLSKNWIKNKITSFDTDIIIKSLLENEPVVFWYLSKNKSGTLNTSPIYWKTKDNKLIKWYIWEHTGVIVWVTFHNNWEINEIQFYEGRSENMQIFKYEDIAYQSSFFNIMITKE